MNHYSMLKIIGITALCFLFFSLSGQEDPVCKSDHLLSIQEARNAARRLAFRSSPHTATYDLKYHRLQWTIDPNLYYIQGEITSYFVPMADGFQGIQFDLYSGLTVREVIRNGKTLSFIQHPDDRLEIRFGETLATDRLDSVSIHYEGVPRRSSFGSFSQGFHNNVPVIWTLSEPYGALDWWPCKQSLDDKIDSIDVLVRTPQAYRAASNGILVEEQSLGTEKIYHWKHRYPIPSYLIAIGVTNYAVYSDFVPVEGRAPIEVLNYVYPERLSTFKTQTPATIGIMKLFNQLFGLYPFANEKYGHAQFGFGGGMEHQTMSFMNGFSHLLQAHELAHQWFGDKVTCGSWSDIWLNEGFATYAEGLTYQFGLGNITWKSWLQKTMSSALSAPSGSVFVDDTTNVNRIFSSALSYSKGAILLHMLRWKLGDDAFFQGVQNYVNDPGLAYGFARTTDLKTHLEMAGGQNLDEFFSDWFFGKGYPSYRLFWEQSTQGIKLRIEQSSSHGSVPFFEMPVPVQFKGADKDTILVFDHRSNGQEFLVSLPFLARELVLDPELWILSGSREVFNTVTSTVEAESAELQVWPNPASDELFFNLPSPQATFELHNQQGQLLKAGLAIPPLDIHDLPAGVYHLRLRDRAGGLWLGRFVK